MKVNFKMVTKSEWEEIEKDPYTFYIVPKKDFSLTIGLYDNYYNLIKTWEQLVALGLNLERDYSDNPNDPNYYDKPESGSAKSVLDGNGLSGNLVVPSNLNKIGNNALRNSSVNGLTSPSDNLTPGKVNIPQNVSVGNNAFSGTDVSEVNIPSNAGAISGSAFDNTPAANTNNINMGNHPIQNLEVNLEDSSTANVILEKGYYYKVTALYNFVDDVTHETTISSSDESKVIFIPDCYLKAVDVGECTISGIYTTVGGTKRYAEINCTVVNNGGGVTTHVGGTPVRENVTEYSYDEVVYCLDCGIELSRTTIYPHPEIYGGVYGAKWLGTSDPSWSRTDDAQELSDPVPAVSNGDGSSPFDSIMPWAGMEVVEDVEAGSLVKIPKFWYKWTKTGSEMQLQISNAPKTGFFVSPAHANRGDGVGERNFVYVGRYHCASDYKSKPNEYPQHSVSFSNFGTRIHLLGENIWLWDYAMYWTIRMLYLVEYANWDAQNKIGYGCSPNGNIFKMGYTDKMVYHTGTNALNISTYGGTQYRYIEGLWDNCYDWCGGIRLSYDKVYCENNPSEDIQGFHQGSLIFSSRPYTNSSNYHRISAYYIPSVNGYEYALFPSTIGALPSVYVGDCYNCTSSGEIIYVGGNYNKIQANGLFAVRDCNGTITSSAIGSRLMKLP